MTGLKWLERNFLPLPYLTLCLTEKEFERELKRLKSPDRPRFVSSGANATTHTLQHEKGGLVCLVCLEGWEEKGLSQIVGLLAHEATHVFQEAMDDYREQKPGDEVQAYGVQHITQQLFEAFTKRTKLKAKWGKSSER